MVFGHNSYKELMSLVREEQQISTNDHKSSTNRLFWTFQAGKRTTVHTQTARPYVLTKQVAEQHGVWAQHAAAIQLVHLVASSLSWVLVLKSSRECPQLHGTIWKCLWSGVVKMLAVQNLQMFRLIQLEDQSNTTTSTNLYQLHMTILHIQYESWYLLPTNQSSVCWSCTRTLPFLL